MLAGMSAGCHLLVRGLRDRLLRAGPGTAARRPRALLAGSCCPHYDGEPLRRPTYRRLIGSGFPAGYAVDDGAALVFAGTELEEVVASTPEARAYRVTLGPDGVIGDADDDPLPGRLTGDPISHARRRAGIVACRLARPDRDADRDPSRGARPGTRAPEEGKELVARTADRARTRRCRRSSIGSIETSRKPARRRPL